MKKYTVTLTMAILLIFGIGLAMAMHHEIKIQEKAGIGKYFTDTEGKTLYTFKNDSPGKSETAQRRKDHGFRDNYEERRKKANDFQRVPALLLGQ
jgi:predicted lipoprotein with Yx(FWY)xxD motif